MNLVSQNTQPTSMYRPFRPVHYSYENSCLKIHALSALTVVNSPRGESVTPLHAANRAQSCVPHFSQPAITNNSNSNSSNDQYVSPPRHAWATTCVSAPVSVCTLQRRPDNCRNHSALTSICVLASVVAFSGSPASLRRVGEEEDDDSVLSAENHSSDVPVLAADWTVRQKKNIYIYMGRRVWSKRRPFLTIEYPTLTYLHADERCLPIIGAFGGCRQISGFEHMLLLLGHTHPACLNWTPATSDYLEF